MAAYSLSQQRESLEQVNYKMKSHITSRSLRSSIHHRCHILLVRRKSWILSTLKERGVTQKLEHQQQDHGGRGVGGGEIL